MLLELALKNLFYDRVRFLITITGIVFSVLLIAIQLGLYAGASRMITDAIRHAETDFWIVGYGTQSFEEGPLLPTGQERSAVLSIDGVASAVPILVTFNYWHRIDGGFTTVLIVGSDQESGGLRPWNLLDSETDALKTASGATVDINYLDELGINSRFDRALVENKAVRVTALTKNIRSFTQAPLVFMPLSRARDVLDLERDATTFILVRLAPGANAETVRAELKQRVPGTEILTTAEFKSRSLNQWLWRTGAGIALIGGCVLGLIVGAIIVSQTLYQSIKDSLIEFATLRAIGASSGYLCAIVLAQAMISSVVGYMLGLIVVGIVVYATQDSTLPVIVSGYLAGFVFLLTLTMSAVASVAAVVKILRIDPAVVFFR